MEEDLTIPKDLQISKLSEYTDEELREELSRRHEAFLLVVKIPESDDGSCYRVNYDGGYCTAIGMACLAQKNILHDDVIPKGSSQE